jgi:DNA-binding NtrC family response regulator
MGNFASKPTIMIIDDEQNFSESLLLAIEDEFTVSRVASLNRAREALKTVSPNAILLDLQLPDGEGIELLRELKKASKMPIVIVMTAYATADSIVEARSEGAVDYFIKPIDIEKLKIELRINLENRKLSKMDCTEC